ncbi:MAG: four helix bundle protein [Bacteroidia bacterium]
MATIKRFEDLECWQLARELEKDVFLCTKIGGLSRDFKMRDQMLSSSGSIMDNIAEGFERGGNKEFSQFLSIAKGSAGELKSQLYRAMDRGYILKEEFETLYNKTEIVAKKISGLMNYLADSEMKGSKYKHRL